MIPSVSTWIDEISSEADKDSPCGALNLDEACLRVPTTNGTNDFRLLTQSTECVGCDPWEVWRPGDRPLIVVNTTYPTLVNVVKGDKTLLCNFTYGFEEFGVYRLNAKKCIVDVEKEGVNVLMPLLWAALILAGLKLVWTGLRRIYKTRACRRFIMRMVMSTDVVDDLGTPGSNSIVLSSVVAGGEEGGGNEKSEVDASTRKQRKLRRVRSLDAFRGLAVTIMIFVNYGGGQYYFFEHATWNGLSVADLVFPWFMWIMGVSMTISIQSQLRSSTSRKTLLKRIFKRSVMLVVIGMVLNSHGNNDLRTFRLPGVLQRFGLTYFVNGLIEALLMPREILPLEVWWSPIRDIVVSRYQWLIMLSLLAIHILLTFFLPVPGCPTGYLGPGGLHDGGKYFNCTGGSAGYIDLIIIGEDHIYQHPTSKIIYNSSVPFDPEGLLGCLTATFIVFLGVQAGKTLLTFPEAKARIIRWLIWSLVLGAIAGGLCGFSRDDGWIPVNKNLWSVSFILATASMAFFLLSIMYLLVDRWKIWSGSPFFYPGVNPMLLYVGHSVLSGFLPFSWKPYTVSHTELLFMDIWGVSVWIFIAYVCYKKKIFISL